LHPVRRNIRPARFVESTPFFVVAARFLVPATCRIWKSQLRLSLVSIPIELFTAARKPAAKGPARKKAS